MSDLASVVGAAASAANPVTAIVGLGKDLIDKFIPDPAQKAAATQQLLATQVQLQETLIAQQTALVQQAGANVQGDHLSAPRQGFCWMVVALLFWNYALCRLWHQQPIDIPLSLIGAFTALMLGEAGFSAVKTVSAMPGDSNASLLGMKFGNKPTAE